MRCPIWLYFGAVSTADLSHWAMQQPLIVGFHWLNSTIAIAHSYTFA
ncbi:MAG: hypothetical protein MJA27_34980 [Pseudanabaenales cyanobacterium]|nr:hypothetical protein [Pseudanabaenales cyanobacterium]